MNPQLYQDAHQLVEHSHRILLLTHTKADCDGLGAALAAYSVLKQMGKDPVVVTADPISENMRFLPSIDLLQNSLGGDEFVIQLDISRTLIDKIKYNTSDDARLMNIVITPKNGVFSDKDVQFRSGEMVPFDLIMIFDTGNLEHLGSLYEKNVDLFYNTPLINIDHHASNTHFGQVNLLDPTAASATEVLYGFLKDLETRHQKTYLNADIATLLLAGIITDTGSFQHANTSPRSMETAAELLDLGARQQEIIKNIYKTKSSAP
ncbi:DHH family phosphoesterase [Candidatus Peregrinibacteria bacterium]|nr:MAG: DHH family phosphoesterase [Candidatus Peregrinibacteria bacterium]